MSEMELPLGFQYAAMASGIKKNNAADMGLIVSAEPAACAGVFTQNQVIAAPLQVTRPRIKGGRCQAILVNSGNANACTGPEGLQVATATAELLATTLDVPSELVAVASTGVIGQPLPFAPFESAVPKLARTLAPQSINAVAEAMMTTDRFVKLSSIRGEILGESYHILGVAKGAGMIHPNMATMLGFVMTDALLDSEQLQRLLGPAVDNSFNSITVDGDTSTNDMVLLLANGASNSCRIMPYSAEESTFVSQLQQVLLDLAKMIVRDGEGATKLAEIRVVGAVDRGQARKVAKAVATSSLVKTAFFGEDANWGRIISAVGYSGADIEPEAIDIYFDDVLVARSGLSEGEQVEKPATAVLQKPEFCVTIDLHLGSEKASYYTSDLTYDYVKINADYRT